MKLTGFADDYKVDPAKNSAKIPVETDVSWLGEISHNGTSILCLDVDQQDNDLYIDGVTSTQWVVGYGYGTAYLCLGVFDNFLEASEVARETLSRFSLAPLH
ncbi:hypothetical protein [Rhodocyclus tenuis]|uniref:Uncharacterized protein n=1 Tax=Rhodocyclus tenuis TaxID=1066 RepID=A0A840GAJ4_RHOTE|nr:hypothetical protein [Rhodocyclus tenuis]MBB4245662.1 hypothetical protein [Rhodocyclus tenuis]